MVSPFSHPRREDGQPTAFCFGRDLWELVGRQITGFDWNPKGVIKMRSIVILMVGVMVLATTAAFADSTSPQPTAFPALYVTGASGDNPTGLFQLARFGRHGGWYGGYSGFYGSYPGWYGSYYPSRSYGWYYPDSYYPYEQCYWKRGKKFCVVPGSWY
jgi:hypothetical protein